MQRFQRPLPMLDLATGQLPTTGKLGGGGSACAEQRGRPDEVVDDRRTHDEAGLGVTGEGLRHGIRQSALRPGSLTYQVFCGFWPEIVQAQ